MMIEVVPMEEFFSGGGGQSDDDISVDEDDIEPIEVLLQFIPYYGQGDGSNDSIVRATLTALSVEDIDSKDEYGNTLLLLACQYRCEDLVRMMISKGADPNAVNSSGACCLHFACYRESASFQVAKVLLQNGANPDVAESTFGCTPLHYCAGTGDIKFCKLLLSYGAQITARDFYNYTCVDYAKEAGMVEVENFLRNHYEKAQGSAMNRNKNAALSPTQSSKDMAAYSDMSKWESHVDPDTKNTYYIHVKTGECLWENELKQRVSAYKGQNKKSKSDKKKSSSKSQTPEFLIQQATQARLIGFLTKHDPSRLVEMDELLAKYKGKEINLLKDLCEKYKVEEDSEFKAFESKLNEFKSQQEAAVASASPPPAKGGGGGGGGGDIKAFEEEKKKIQTQFEEEKRGIRKEYEKELEDQKAAMKKKIEQYLESEKESMRKILSEKEGIITKAKADLEGLEKTKLSLQEELQKMSENVDKKQNSTEGDIRKLEEEIQVLTSANAELKESVNVKENELSRTKEELKDTQRTLDNVTGDTSERVAADQAAAHERAQAMEKRDAEHAQGIKELESKAKTAELRSKSEFSQAKNDWTKLEKQLRDEQDQVKKSKDQEIETMRKEIGESSSKAAQDLMEKTLLVEELMKKVEDAQNSRDEATATAQAAQDKIAEARITHKKNDDLHKDLVREQLRAKKLHNELEDMKGKIRVYVRVRPFSKSELAKNCGEGVMKDGRQSVLVKGHSGPDSKKNYEFDSVFGGSDADGNTQEDVFKDTKHLMMSVIDGYNVCIFAYGQTGAGKSFTMVGAADIGSCVSESGEFDPLAGIIPRAVVEVFRLLQEREGQQDFSVEVQMFQLYRDGLEDLLKEKKATKDAKEGPLKITLAEHSASGLVEVDGAVIKTASTAQEVMKIVELGSKRRTTASTQMNAESSRSHLIVSLKVTLTNQKTGGQVVGKLTLVDLAGSERLDKSGATGEGMKEAQSINKSLSALGDVIACLTTGQGHIPYRNHPLTMLMSDSIGGNAKTLMFVNTSPADYNVSESNSSLGFALRCKDVQNTAGAGGGGGASAAQIKALKGELSKLKKGGGGGGAQLSGLRRP